MQTRQAQKAAAQKKATKEAIKLLGADWPEEVVASMADEIRNNEDKQIITELSKGKLKQDPKR